MTTLQVSPGTWFPLGATCDPGGSTSRCPLRMRPASCSFCSPNPPGRPPTRSALRGGHAMCGKASDAAERAPGLSTGSGSIRGRALQRRPSTTRSRRSSPTAPLCCEGRAIRRGADRLTKASTHWMRHSHASHAIAAGMPIEIAQQNLGTCVARHDNGLCDNREQAADEGRRNVLAEVALTWVPTRLPADSAEFHHSFRFDPPPLSLGPVESKVASCPWRTTINAGRTITE